MSWTLTLPLETPSHNTTNGWHWLTRHRHTKVCQAHLLKAGAAAIPQATGRRRVHILTFRAQKCRDFANLVGGCKGLIDAMVRCKLLVDDSDAYAVISYDQSTRRFSPLPKRSATVISLSDIT